MAYPEPLERLVAAFARFPGVGRRTAERLAFHVLRDESARSLAAAIEHAVAKTVCCRTCFNVAQTDPCAICADPERDVARVLVVEQPRDVEAVERSGAWKGRYHVLMGAFNPADGTEVEHLTLAGLARRVRAGGIAEVVIGTDPDAEGEATALVVRDALRRAAPGAGGTTTGLRVTRLARGLPAGSALEYLHRGVLEDAIEARREL